MQPDDPTNLNLSGQQAGDQTFGNVAGHDIHHGISAGDAVQLVREVWRFDQKLDILREETRLYQEMERARWLAEEARDARVRRHLVTLYGVAILALVVALVGLL